MYHSPILKSLNSRPAVRRLLRRAGARKLGICAPAHEHLAALASPPPRRQSSTVSSRCSARFLDLFGTETLVPSTVLGGAIILAAVILVAAAPGLLRPLPLPRRRSRPPRPSSRPRRPRSVPACPSRADDVERLGCVLGSAPLCRARSVSLDLPHVRRTARPPCPRDPLFTFDFDIFDGAGFFAMVQVLQNKAPR